MWTACVALLPSVVAAQQKEPFTGLDAYVEGAMRQWKVPGLAIAVVRNDSVLYAKGYGVREAGKPDRVDANTVFAIGSDSKAFTSAAVAMLVDEKKVSLDAPVAAYLPGFQLADNYASREVTVRDVLSHRTGASRSELSWYGAGFDRDELVRRVRFLPTQASFRSQFIYQNVMFVAAGQLVARVAGATWDDFVRARIFAPLGMTSSSTSVRALAGVSNLATPHASSDETVRAIAWRNVDNVGPAGGINSTAVDMAQWLRLQLGDGTFNGKRLLSARLLDEMHSPQTIIPSPPTPETHLTTYGLGWIVQDYRGRLMVHHSGGIDGFISLVAMLPEQKFGVVVLTNMNGTGVTTPLVNRIMDMQLGAPARDWSAEAYARTSAQLARAAEAQRRLDAQRVPNTKPSLPLAAYAGTYADSLYGEIVVTESNGALAMTFGPTWTGALEHWHFDTFHTRFDTPVLGTIPITFRLDAAGKVSDLQADLAGTVTFKRRPTPAAAPSPR